MKTNKSGFTLIEMIVVISIIAIMAGVSYPSLLAYRNHNIDQERENHELLINKAMNQYYALSGRYPSLAAAIDFETTVPFNLTPAGETKLTQELTKITGVSPNIATYHFHYRDAGGVPDLTKLTITNRP